MLWLCVGFTGMTMILIAFFMNQSGTWKTDSLYYDSFNAGGSLLMVIYALAIQSWPFLFLNLVWFAVSVREIFTDLKGKKVDWKAIRL